MSKRKYTEEEDKKILQAVKKFATLPGFAGSPKGNKLWKELEEQKLTLHSWQSMKDRYKRLQEQKNAKKNETNETPKKGSKSKKKAKKAAEVEKEEEEEQEEEEGEEEEEEEEENVEPSPKQPRKRVTRSMKRQQETPKKPQKEEVEETRQEEKVEEKKQVEQAEEEQAPQAATQGEEAEEAEEAEDGGIEEDVGALEDLYESKQEEYQHFENVDAREVEDVKRLVKFLSQTYKLHPNTVFHALFVHSGNVRQARKYLETGKSSNRAWQPEDDDAVLGKRGSGALKEVISKRGQKEVETRAKWIES